MNEMKQVDPNPQPSMVKPFALLISGIVACAVVGTGIFVSYTHNLAYQNAVDKPSEAKVKDTSGSLITQAAAQDGSSGISVGQGDQVQGTSKQTASTAAAAPSNTKPLALPHPSAAQTKAPAAPVAVPNCDWPQAMNIPNEIKGLLTGEVCMGSGTVAAAQKWLTINYNGMLLNGTLFDSSYVSGRKPLSFQLGAGGVIPGMEQGVNGMKVGGKRVLVIPPDLAYGSGTPAKTIPPNSTLVFMVELLDVSDAKPATP